MKITHKENMNVKTFDEVEIGEVFTLGNQYFIKTPCGMDHFTAHFNAVYLNNGHFACIDGYEKVTLVEYEFNVMV